ncbi:MAG: hypothetical protein K6C99_08775 [Lachnospiraceae bacterium]|nr:hypothetical protein [Lachnospiraceae bacterium]
MKFRRKIQEIITGVLLISVLAGQISEIKVFAAENEGSLSDNSAEESVSADSFDSENIADTYEYSTISTLIDQMSERSVEINMISVSYESNSIMNKLVINNGGTVFDETQGLEYVKEQISEDLKKRLDN